MMTPQFEIVSARQFNSGLPKDLPALILFKTDAQVSARVCSVGDMGFSGNIHRAAQTHGYSALLQTVAPFLRDSEVTFANLETPLLQEVHNKQLFAASTASVHSLSNCGFSILNLANNHIYDYGGEGLRSTLEACQIAGMLTLGAGDTPSAAKSLVRTDANGIKIGWLGCARTLSPQMTEGPHYWEWNEEETLHEIAVARQQVDILFVSIHTGLMYLDYPHPDHKAAAERLQKAGADVILMHHAHVLQSAQVNDYGQTICYNLGNFLLDWQEGNVVNSMMVEEQNESAIFVFDLHKQGIAQVFAVPIFINEECSIQWAEGARGEKIFKRLQNISADICGEYTHLFEKQRAERNAGPLITTSLFHLRRRNWLYFSEQIVRLRFEHVKMLLRYLIQQMIVKAKHG